MSQITEEQILTAQLACQIFTKFTTPKKCSTNGETKIIAAVVIAKRIIQEAKK